MGTHVVLMLLLIINAIVPALRRTGQLTGEPDHDRRRVLALLGSLPLAQFVGPHQPFRDTLVSNPVLAAQVDDLIRFSFDGLLRDVQ